MCADQHVICVHMYVNCGARQSGCPVSELCKECTANHSIRELQKACVNFSCKITMAASIERHWTLTAGGQAQARSNNVPRRTVTPSIKVVAVVVIVTVVVVTIVVVTIVVVVVCLFGSGLPVQQRSHNRY